MDLTVIFLVIQVLSLVLAISDNSDGTVVFIVIATDLDGESTVPFEHRILYVVVDVGDTDIEPFASLSTPSILHLSALVLAHVRVDDWPGMIDAGEAANVVTTGVIGFGSILTTIDFWMLPSTSGKRHTILYFVVFITFLVIEPLIGNFVAIDAGGGIRHGPNTGQEEFVYFSIRRHLSPVAPICDDQVSTTGVPKGTVALGWWVIDEIIVGLSIEKVKS